MLRFDWPDWDAPLDVDAYLRRVPEGATGKGMVPQVLVREIEGRELHFASKRRFFAFNDSPLPECMAIILEGGELLYPELPKREQLRRVAWPSYSTFADTMIGRVIFGGVGHNVESIFKLASKAISHSTNVGKIESEVIDDSTVIVRTQDN